MNILRLSTLSLTLAVAVFALGYNPSFADQPGSGPCGQPHCGHGGDDSGFPTGMTVQLEGGAFVSDGPPVPVTAEAFDILRGDAALHMIRPGGVDLVGCADMDPSIMTLCLAWNSVFNLCGLLGAQGQEDVPEFTVQGGGKKAWSIGTVADELRIFGQQVRVYLGFEVNSPLETTDPLYTADPLHVGLRFKGSCLSPECGLIPAEGTSMTINLDAYGIHLKGKGGVTHEADCHAGRGLLLYNGATNLVITRP